MFCLQRKVYTVLCAQKVVRKRHPLESTLEHWLHRVWRSGILIGQSCSFCRITIYRFKVFVDLQRSRVHAHLYSVGEEGEVELLASVRGSIHFGQHSVLIIIIIIIIIIVNPCRPTLTLIQCHNTHTINRILLPSTSRSRRGPFYNPQQIFTQNSSLPSTSLACSNRSPVLYRGLKYRLSCRPAPM